MKKVIKFGRKYAKIMIVVINEGMIMSVFSNIIFLFSNVIIKRYM